MDVVEATSAPTAVVPDIGELQSLTESDTSMESSVGAEPASWARAVLLRESRLFSVLLSEGESISMFMSSSLAAEGCFSSSLGSDRGFLRFFTLMRERRESLGGEHEGEGEEEEEDEEDPPPIPEWTKWSLSAWSCIARMIWKRRRDERKVVEREWGE